MIEPVKHTPNTFDVSCADCGEVKRFVVRFGLLLPALKGTGWKVEAGRHRCPECAEVAAA